MRSKLVRPVVFLIIVMTLSLSAQSADRLYQNERRVLGFMRGLYDVQATYRYNYGNGNYGITTTLSEVGLVPPFLGQFWIGWGYGFMSYANGRTHERPPQFTIVAFPYRWDGKLGKYSYLINSRCEIRREDASGGQHASETSPILETCFPYMAANNEPKVIARIRAIASAQETYRSSIGMANYARSLKVLSDAGLIEPVVSATVEWYAISMTAIPATESSPPTFRILVKPRYYRESGLRSFFLDQTGVLRGADHAGGDASENDPPVDQLVQLKR